MSGSARRPALVLATTVLVTLGAIGYSHVTQVTEKLAMKEGVERDKARIKAKRAAARRSKES